MLGGHLMEVQLYLLCQENFIFPGKSQIIVKNNDVFGNHVDQCDHVFFLILLGASELLAYTT